MATNAAAWVRALDTWSVITVHDWDGTQAIETTLANALGDLPDAPDGVLYDHVDLEALVGVLEPSEGRGASRVEFEYGRFQVRIEDDGTIAVA